jgi:hypothetical protein
MCHQQNSFRHFIALRFLLFFVRHPGEGRGPAFNCADEMKLGPGLRRGDGKNEDVNSSFKSRE